MNINRLLLTHDNVDPTGGKVLDLGFNGDFDVKMTYLNSVFVAFPASASENGITLSVKTADTKVGVISATAIGSVTVPKENVAKGGVWGMPMPRGLKRYFTLEITGTEQNVTAGITDVIDTDCNPGVDWTYYKANTKNVGVPGPIEKLAYVVYGDD